MAKEQQVYVSYINPFRIIVDSKEMVFHFTLEEINQNTYNHGLLCRIVGEIDNRYRNETDRFSICADGAIALQKVFPDEHEDEVFLHFSDFLCKMLIGGIITDSVNGIDIAKGRKNIDRNIIWPVDFGESLSSYNHGKIRMRLANSVDTIILSDPRHIVFGNMAQAFETGRRILDKISNVSSYYFISGITAYRQRNWAATLSNLWIVVEQLIESLWENEFIDKRQRRPIIPLSGRKEALKDYRTYTSNVKLEFLFQMGIIPCDVYEKLFLCRKARNKLVHDAATIHKSVVTALIEALPVLMEIAAGEVIPLFQKEII